MCSFINESEFEYKNDYTYMDDEFVDKKSHIECPESDDKRLTKNSDILTTSRISALKKTDIPQDDVDESDVTRFIFLNKAKLHDFSHLYPFHNFVLQYNPYY